MWNNNPYHWFTAMHWLYSFVYLFCLLHFLISFYSIRFDLIWYRNLLFGKNPHSILHSREKHVQFQPIRIFLYGTLELFHFLYFTNCSVFAYHFYRHSFVKLRILFKHIFDSAIRKCRNIFFFLYLHTWKLRSQLLFLRFPFATPTKYIRSGEWTLRTCRCSGCRTNI